jgi:hypothetical protein
LNADASRPAAGANTRNIQISCVYGPFQPGAITRKLANLFFRKPLAVESGRDKSNERSLNSSPTNVHKKLDFYPQLTLRDLGV